MRLLLHCIILILVVAVVHASAQSLEKAFPSSFSVTVTNPLTTDREGVLIVISPEQLARAAKKFNSKAFVVLDGETEIPSQYNHADPDHKGIVFVLDKLAASESRKVTVRFHAKASIERNYPRRAQAELSHRTGGAWQNREYIGGDFKNVDYLRVPPEHKDHSWFIRYEGPGWESDKVGYRFYLDQRNATDVFGKKTSDMVLQQVGLDGFDSYHNPQPWGMDVMKVGKSLGVGSIGSLVDGAITRVERTDSVDCRITENGAVYASILTRYFGWQVGDKKHDLRSRLSIHGGTRLTHGILDITNDPANIATGIVKDKAAKLFTSGGDHQHWAYLATYGKQSLNDDHLGLAVFFRPGDIVEMPDNEFSHVVTLHPANGRLHYYFLGSWEGEPGGIRDETAFLDYVRDVAAALANPVTIDIE
ncbi:MAG TPA: DUF4861 domain-containing protein [Ohtaekwangia sp.]|nr:DUF4861 domain-containing protein [Ohtaekwangia sp.]